jgi:hypothetical protein
MADETDSAISGGMLVVLGIIVAVIVGVFFYNYSHRSTTDVSIIEVPPVDQPAPINVTPPDVNVEVPAPNVNVQQPPDVNVQVPAPNINVEEAPSDTAPAE